MRSLVCVEKAVVSKLLLFVVALASLVLNISVSGFERKVHGFTVK